MKEYLDENLSSAAERLIELVTGEDTLRALHSGMNRLAPQDGRRTINLADPKVMHRLRREPSLLPEQVTDKQLEAAIRTLIDREYISVEGWNGSGPMPNLQGPRAFRALLL